MHRHETRDGSRHGGYRHEAFFYADTDAFMAGVVPFISQAVEAGEPLLAVLSAPKIAALEDALRDVADGVLFADMAEVGTNPARIIPAWQAFLDARGADDRAVRGIGEPIWAGRSDAELAECERHEALLNAAFADPAFWLLCPYDVGALPEAVLEEARRNHPFVADATGAAPSAAYPGTAALTSPFDRPLPEPPAHAQRLIVERSALRDVRDLVGGQAEAAGLAAEPAADLVLTVNELATNTVRHGGGRGLLTVWREDDAIVCDVRDQGRIDDPFAGRVEPPVTTEGGRGLWMANQLCELVQVRAYSDGGTVRVHKRIA
jgi:anti-sigma regulatory factor (Ser/Thr protein kinase)